MEDSSLFRVVLVFWFVSSFLVMFLLSRIDWIMHRELYNFGLQFSYVWADPYWLSLRMIYVCLAIPSILSAVLLVLDIRNRTKGSKPSSEGDLTPTEGDATPTGMQSKEPGEVSILQLVRLVDRDFENHWYNMLFRRDMVLPFAFILVVAFTEFSLLFSNAPDYEKVAVCLGLIGAVIAFSTLASPFIERKIVEANFKRLERYYWKCICSEKEIKPLLKALVKMKAKHRNIELQQIYSLNAALFDKKELLKKLYE